MCYFRHYNKSSNWYPFVGLETFLFINNCLIDNSLLHARPNCDQTLASFEDYRSPALVYSLLYTASNVVVALFEEYC